MELLASPVAQRDLSINAVHHAGGNTAFNIRENALSPKPCTHLQDSVPELSAHCLLLPFHTES